jgi:DNA-binding transcriptional MerR regulator
MNHTLSSEQVQYLTTSEVSRITGLAEQTLHNYRHMGIGIPYTKLNRAVRYSLSDVMDFMRSHRIDPEAY